MNMNKNFCLIICSFSRKLLLSPLRRTNVIVSCLCHIARTPSIVYNIHY
ncbi:hypothetical protein HanXRQr2_Chr01g0042081 [Helianthus annuus]|uniref:Uncharacterized protein n=1 Tax=Helianthus annuus TaxID=4232 RepID=A0A9K3JYU3_HELAN|nr:hypothetical protein HanXRQr2_Chr01g0042081 [Helianthus annuus]KAJ0958618.1 hypothetical protein HanPSC8_Chr01g0040921 [Helianthus annuus]